MRFHRWNDETKVSISSTKINARKHKLSNGDMRIYGDILLFTITEFWSVMATNHVLYIDIGTTIRSITIISMVYSSSQTAHIWQAAESQRYIVILIRFNLMIYHRKSHDTHSHMMWATAHYTWDLNASFGAQGCMQNSLPETCQFACCMQPAFECIYTYTKRLEARKKMRINPKTQCPLFFLNLYYMVVVCGRLNMF